MKRRGLASQEAGLPDARAFNWKLLHDIFILSNSEIRPSLWKQIYMVKAGETISLSQNASHAAKNASSKTGIRLLASSLKRAEMIGGQQPLARRLLSGEWSRRQSGTNRNIRSELSRRSGPDAGEGRVTAQMDNGTERVRTGSEPKRAETHRTKRLQRRHRGNETIWQHARGRRQQLMRRNCKQSSRQRRNEESRANE